MKTFDSGAKSSEAAPRYDLIPLASLQRQAARMALGAASHGERNYRKGVDDPVFIRDRVNHLLGHALAYASGDTSDDHLGAVLANAGMLADLEAMRVPASDIHESRTGTPFITNEPPTILNANTPDTEYHPSRQCGCASCQRMTYDERRGEIPPCQCGRLFTHPHRCREQGRCLALDHPHATPLRDNVQDALEDCG